MKKFLLSLSTCLCILNLSAQNFLWAKQIAGSSYAQGIYTTADAMGNSISVGNFQNTPDFDPSAGTYTLSSQGSLDIYISKLDNAGNFLWAKQIGGKMFDAARAITVDKANNIYVIGNYQDTVDFNPSPLPTDTFFMIPAGGTDFFVCKLSPTGKFIWAKSFGGLNLDNGNNITVDAASNLILVGNFDGTADFNPGTLPADTFFMHAVGTDALITKLDSAGHFIWAKQINGTQYNYALSVVTDAANNIFYTGQVYGRADFNPDTLAADTFFITPATGVEDVFVSALNASGNFMWAKSFAGNTNASGNSISIDTHNNLIVCGGFSGVVDFNPDTLAADTFKLTAVGNTTDIFIAKLNPQGKFRWAGGIGGNNTDIAFQVTTNSADEVYTIGNFGTTVDFDPDTLAADTFNLTTFGGGDIFVSRFDSTGAFQWVKQMGGSGADYGKSICLGPNASFFATGYFSTTADFNASPATYTLTASPSGINGYAVKYGLCNTSSTTQNVSICQGTAYSINSHLYGLPGTYYDTLHTSMGGCDSMVTTNLSVNYITAAFTYTPSGGSNQFFFQDSSYFSTGNSITTYSWSFVNSGGTQTSNVSNPTVVLNSYTTTVCLIVTTVNGCSDTTCKLITQTITGINQINNQAAISIYPNPANNKITIDANDIVDVKLFDVLGKQITTIKENQIDVSNLPNAVYFIQVQTKQGITTQKIVVQH